MEAQNQANIELKRHNSEVFSLGNDVAYGKWREKKLAESIVEKGSRPIRLRNLSQPAKSTLLEVATQCEKNNLAIYQLADSTIDAPRGDQKNIRADLKSFCAKLGLYDCETNRSQGDDGVVAIRVDDTGIGAGYIPYTPKALSWHTDGYYNAPQARIRAMVLHCVRDASEGGVNEFLDPDIMYIRLRDENPHFVEALMHEEAMTIPENKDERSAYRPPSIGPVFFLDEKTGTLNMRYSARTRNILWREGTHTDKAREMLGEVLRGDPLVVRHKLKPGQGIISNNVLHNRTAFEQLSPANKNPTKEHDGGRLLYRIRYNQRVALPG